jgi:hypothetical protein
LLVGWLVAISPNSLSVFPGLLAPGAADGQTTAPAGNEDPSEDSAAAADCTLQNRRLEICVSAPVVVRLKAVTFNPPARRQSPAFVLPRIWQFVQRAAAAPRAPAFTA